MSYGDKETWYYITVDTEFSLENCTLSSAELIDIHPDIPMNALESDLENSIKKHYPNIGKYLEYRNSEVIHDFSASWTSGFGTIYNYTIEVIMAIHTKEHKQLNLLKLKYPDEISKINVHEFQ